MTTLKKIGFVIASIIALVVVLSFSSHIYVTSQKADIERDRQAAYTKNIFTPEEIRQDIAYFAFLLENVHPRAIPSFPFSSTSSETARLSRMISRPLSRLALYRLIAPVGNLLNDEHTMVFPAEMDLKRLYAPGIRLFPFDVRFEDQRLYVTRDLSNEQTIRVGAEIVSINALTTQMLRKNMMSYYSGTSDNQKLFYLQKNFREALRLVYNFGDYFEIVVSGQGPNETESHTVFGRAFDQPEFEPFRYDIVDPKTILFTYNAFEDKHDSFAAFLEEMFAEIKRQGIQALIIDIRDNQGGATAYGDDLLEYLIAAPFSQMSHVDLTVSDELRRDFLGRVPAWIRWFPVQYVHPLMRPLWKNEIGDAVTINFDRVVPGANPLRFTGGVYLLIGPGTMSSASLLAASMQKYKVATLVGEPTGGYATMYGNVVDTYLPNTGLRVSIPTSIVYGNQTGPVVPDHVVTQNLSDLLENLDTVRLYVMDVSN